jgi:predicted nucleic acid-binding protein
LRESVLADTGAIVGLFAAADQHHTRCVPVSTSWLPRAAWLLRRDHLPLDESDLPPISAILTKYRDLRLQLADAALLHLANRDRIPTIFTFDRRDFELVRLKNGKRPRLIP